MTKWVISQDKELDKLLLGRSKSGIIGILGDPAYTCSIDKLHDYFDENGHPDLKVNESLDWTEMQCFEVINEKVKVVVYFDTDDLSMRVELDQLET